MSARKADMATLRMALRKMHRRACGDAVTVTRLDLVAAAFVAVALAVSAHSVGFQRGLDLAREWEGYYNNESERADGYRRALWHCQDELSTSKVTP